MKLACAGAVLLGGLAIAVSASALAQASAGIDPGAPVMVAQAPAYLGPPPPPPPRVYYTPPPPPPPPVYYAPPPPPVVIAPPGLVIGWYGDRYWDGQRYWSRAEWYRRHPPGRGHWNHGGPPPP